MLGTQCAFGAYAIIVALDAPGATPCSGVSCPTAPAGSTSTALTASPIRRLQREYIQ
ncbi:hypothetical protein Micbo1qcDRAFT_158117, partial [Microdochium bolleyi]